MFARLKFAHAKAPDVRDEDGQLGTGEEASSQKIIIALPAQPAHLAAAHISSPT